MIPGAQLPHGFDNSAWHRTVSNRTGISNLYWGPSGGTHYMSKRGRIGRIRRRRKMILW